MTRPVRGLYEALITDALDANLRGAGPRAARQQLGVAEAADRIALHLAGIVERAVFALLSQDAPPAVDSLLPCRQRLLRMLVNASDLHDDAGIDRLLGLNFLRNYNYEVRS